MCCPEQNAYQVSSCTLHKKKTDIQLNTLKCSFNRLLMAIDCQFVPRGAANERAGTTIFMTPS